MAQRTKLLLFAHGSRDPAWQGAFDGLARLLAEKLGDEAIGLCFLQFAEPGLVRALDEAAGAGCESVRILPLFFSAGGHVLHDLPALVNEARRRHPRIDLELLPPVGEHPEFGEMLLRIARSALGDC